LQELDSLEQLPEPVTVVEPAPNTTSEDTAPVLNHSEVLPEDGVFSQDTAPASDATSADAYVSESVEAVTSEDTAPVTVDALAQESPVEEEQEMIGNTIGAAAQTSEEYLPTPEIQLDGETTELRVEVSCSLEFLTQSDRAHRFRPRPPVTSSVPSRPTLPHTL
jgi:hypothetical protein